MGSVRSPARYHVCVTRAPARFDTPRKHASELPELIERRGFWKPGETTNGETHRPFLNGEPCPGALCACEIKGYVLIAPDEEEGAPRMKLGYVELRPVPPHLR